MHPNLAVYPVDIERATDIAVELDLNPLTTFMERSRFVGYAFDDLTTATAFRLRFDAERWPTTDEDIFFMYLLDEPEIGPWLASCGGDHEKVEFVAVRFGSKKHRERFEEALWPGQ